VRRLIEFGCGKNIRNSGFGSGIHCVMQVNSMCNTVMEIVGRNDGTLGILFKME
jgi:hypothetical protein